MKCIKKGKRIERVSDKEAAESVREGWKYCPKSEWRKKTRTVPAAKKKSKKSKKKTSK